MQVRKIRNCKILMFFLLNSHRKRTAEAVLPYYYNEAIFSAASVSHSPSNSSIVPWSQSFAS